MYKSLSSRRVIRLSVAGNIDTTTAIVIALAFFVAGAYNDIRLLFNDRHTTTLE